VVATRVFVLLLTIFAVSCPRQRLPTLSFAEQSAAREQKDAYETYALHKSGIAPPGIAFESRRAEGAGIWGTAIPVRPEDADWNQWPDGNARLFNNRMAHLFDVQLHGEAMLGWVPEGTALELNDESVRLVSAASPEDLLVDLLFFAKSQEDWILDGDLVARTRAAGAFRAEYIPAQGDRELSGLIGFPMTTHDDGLEIAERHVVAERLTISVVTVAGIQELVWVFD